MSRLERLLSSVFGGVQRGLQLAPVAVFFREMEGLPETGREFLPEASLDCEELSLGTFIWLHAPAEFVLESRLRGTEP